MNRLREAFAAARGCGRRVLLPYLTAGYPDLATTLEILRRVDARACACVELGVPFTDPIADGPVIQTSFARALERGFRVDALFDALRAARGDIAVPLVAMVSYSIVHRRTPGAFVRSAASAGFDGLIVPDVPLEEAEELARLGAEHACPLVLIVAPTSDASRRRRIAELSDPFVYYQSLAGVTGERAALPAGLSESVAALRRACGKPVCVGFGISNARQVAEVCRAADGAIVGSAIVRRMNESLDAGLSTAELVDAVLACIAELSAGLTAAEGSEAGAAPRGRPAGRRGGRPERGAEGA